MTDGVLASLLVEWRKCRRQAKFDDGENDMCVDPCKRCDRMLKYRRTHPTARDFNRSELERLVSHARQS